MTKILIVDDEEFMTDIVGYRLEQQGYEVHAFCSPIEALDCFRTKKNFDLVISDLKMPELDGISMLKEMRTIDPDIPVIITTAFSDLDLEDLQSQSQGKTLTYPKPIEFETLLPDIKHILDQKTQAS